MKYVHLISNWNYAVSVPFIKFVNANFDNKEHLFLVMDNKSNIPIEIKDFENLKCIAFNNNDLFEKYENYFVNSKLILLHSLSLSNRQKLSLIKKPKLFNKTTWIEWGADLYEWKSKNPNLIKKNYDNIINYMFRKNVKYFVGIFPPDIDFFKNEFKPKAKTVYASYVGNLNNIIYKQKVNTSTLSEKKENETVINIQVGHQGNRLLNHKDVLKELAKYKDENINVYLPLNYGPDKKYMSEVEDLAKEFFGEKAKILKEKMTKDDYMLFLTKMDIAIFNSERQIGLGNITPLLFFGKKIFIPKDTVMFDFYKQQNIEIQDYNELKTMSYSDFVNPVNMESAKRYVKTNELSLENKIKKWTEVFNINV